MAEKDFVNKNLEEFFRIYQENKACIVQEFDKIMDSSPRLTDMREDEDTDQIDLFNNFKDTEAALYFLQAHDQIPIMKK